MTVDKVASVARQSRVLFTICPSRQSYLMNPAGCTLRALEVRHDPGHQAVDGDTIAVCDSFTATQRWARLIDQYRQIDVAARWVGQLLDGPKGHLRDRCEMGSLLICAGQVKLIAEAIQSWQAQGHRFAGMGDYIQ